jgi:hypothetical protein
MIPLPLQSSVQPESSDGCACLSVDSVDPYTARQGVTEKVLIEILEARSPDSDICDSITETLQLEERWGKTAWRLLYLSSS